MSFQDYTDESGVVRLRARGGGGGSQPLEIIRVPLAFDDATLQAGIEVYTPSVGDQLLTQMSTLVVTTGWDDAGDLSLYSDGDASGDYLVFGTGLTEAAPDGAHRIRAFAFPNIISNSFHDDQPYFTDTTPLVVQVNQGSAMQGAALLTLVILKATA